MSWRDYWNADTPIYVSERHRILHYGLIARDIAAYVPRADAAVLDHGCGEALSAGRVAAGCGRLYLCDGAPLVRERLAARFTEEPKIAVLAPEDIESIGDHTLDLVVVNSLLQYLSPEEFAGLLGTWRSKLREGGRLVLADVIAPDTGPLDDVMALLRFAWTGGFLRAALVGLARTALSDYSKLRAELGLTHYGEREMLVHLAERGFEAKRAARNIGHNPKRMTFVATGRVASRTGAAARRRGPVSGNGRRAERPQLVGQEVPEQDDARGDELGGQIGHREAAHQERHERPGQAEPDRRDEHEAPRRLAMRPVAGIGEAAVEQIGHHPAQDIAHQRRGHRVEPVAFHEAEQESVMHGRGREADAEENPELP